MSPLLVNLALIPPAFLGCMSISSTAFRIYYIIIIFYQRKKMIFLMQIYNGISKLLILAFIHMKVLNVKINNWINVKTHNIFKTALTLDR